MDKIKTMRLRLSILPFSSPNVASAETEKPSVDKEGDPGGGGVKAGEGERDCGLKTILESKNSAFNT